jgi:hypothetical protein
VAVLLLSLLSCVTTTLGVLLALGLRENRRALARIMGIGSWPRPAWMLRAIHGHVEKRLSNEEFDATVEDAPRRRRAAAGRRRRGDGRRAAPRQLRELRRKGQRLHPINGIRTRVLALTGLQHRLQ